MSIKKSGGFLNRFAFISAVFILCLCVIAVPAAASSASANWQNYPSVGASSGGVFDYTLGSGDLVVGSEGDRSQFVGISIGSFVLSSNVYTVAQNSCDITIKGTYLNSFEAGEYSVRILFTDGETKATLKIAASEAGAASSSSAPAAREREMLEGGAEATVTQASPNTGVNTVLLGLVSLFGGMTVVFLLGKRWIRQ